MTELRQCSNKKEFSHFARSQDMPLRRRVALSRLGPLLRSSATQRVSCTGLA